MSSSTHRIVFKNVGKPLAIRSLAENSDNQVYYSIFNLGRQPTVLFQMFTKGPNRGPTFSSIPS